VIQVVGILNTIPRSLVEHGGIDWVERFEPARPLLTQGAECPRQPYVHPIELPPAWAARIEVVADLVAEQVLNPVQPRDEVSASETRLSRRLELRVRQPALVQLLDRVDGGLITWPPCGQ